jgi:hypothetical protein
LNATQSTIDPGGSLTIIATVTKKGQTAEDGTTVIFTSSLGGSFSGGSTASAAGDDDTSDDDTSGNTTGTASTTNGVATIVYTASSDLTGNDRITATVYDAYATVDIYIRSL